MQPSGVRSVDAPALAPQRDPSGKYILLETVFDSEESFTRPAEGNSSRTNADESSSSSRTNPDESNSSRTNADESSSSRTNADESNSSRTNADESNSSRTNADERNSSRTNADESNSSRTNADERNSSKTNNESNNSSTNADESNSSKTIADVRNSSRTNADEVNSSKTNADVSNGNKTNADDGNNSKTNADDSNNTKMNVDESSSSSRTNADETNDTNLNLLALASRTRSISCRRPGPHQDGPSGAYLLGIASYCRSNPSMTRKKTLQTMVSLAISSVYGSLLGELKAVLADALTKGVDIGLLERCNFTLDKLRMEKLKQEFDKFQIIQAEWSEEEEPILEDKIQKLKERLVNHLHAVKRLIAHSAGWIAKDSEGQAVFAEMLSSGDFEAAQAIALQRCKILTLNKLPLVDPAERSVPHLLVRGTLTLLENKMPMSIKAAMDLLEIAHKLSPKSFKIETSDTYQTPYEVALSEDARLHLGEQNGEFYEFLAVLRELTPRRSLRTYIQTLQKRRAMEKRRWSN